MADHGHFEHNRQSLRIVDHLEHPYPAFRGLNLTRAVRECLAKHTTRYDTPVSDEFDLSRPAPLEGQLVDVCDEIAYTSADVEDALQAGWITADQLAQMQLWRLAWEQAERKAPDARRIHKQIRATKALLAMLADDAIATTQAAVAAMNLDSPGAVRPAGTKCVAFSDAIARALREVQDFMMREVYTRPVGREHEVRGRRCIAQLFEKFLRQPDALVPRYARRIEAEGLHRVICDYIAGMTDRYCIAEHARLCGP